MNSRRIVRRLVTFLALALIAVPLASPSRAAGDRVSQTRNVAGFDTIRLQGAFDAAITAGAPATRVVVSGDGDSVDRVTTAVSDRELIVGMKSGNFFSHSPHLEIALPVLRGFANEGAGTIKIAGVRGGSISISNAGTASIAVSGRAGDAQISLNGTGRIDTTELAARDVTVDNSGVGTVRVRASGKLTMAVNGVGEIRYTGNPTDIERQVNGVGRISPL